MSEIVPYGFSLVDDRALATAVKEKASAGLVTD